MYKFNVIGHKNITAKHKTTLEFTKDENLSLNGDCIIGVKADFSLKEIKKFIKNSIKNNNNEIKIIICFNNSKEEIIAEINPGFDSDKEMVIRKSEYKDERTLAIRANKASFELKRDLIGYLKENISKISVIFENKVN